MTAELIQQFLAKKRVAVVGVSTKEKDFSRMLFRELDKRGYDVVPVHPTAAEIDGHPSFARLQDVTPPVEAALLMTSPKQTDVVVRDSAEAGVPLLWMYRAVGAGAVSAQAVDFCDRNGIECIVGHCPYMFFPNAGFPHSWHAAFAKLTGSYPRGA